MKFIPKILIFEQIPIQRRGSIPWSPTSQILVPIRPTHFWDQQFLCKIWYWEPLPLAFDATEAEQEAARKRSKEEGKLRSEIDATVYNAKRDHANEITQ